MITKPSRSSRRISPRRQRSAADADAGAMTRYFERRAYLRVPASGDARWTCGTRSGDCQLVDISPGGAGLRFPARRAPSLGDQVRVSVPLGQGGEWRLPGDAHVVRRAPGEDGWYDIGLQFSPENWEV